MTPYQILKWAPVFHLNVNPWWPSDAIWRHRSGLSLVQVMACCLTAPSHYLNQYWLVIEVVPWHSPESNSQEVLLNLICNMSSETTLVKLLPHLTHWGRVTHICVGKLTTIGSDNGLSPERRQAIIWTNAGILLIGPLGTNFSEIFIEIQAFSFKKMHLKISSANWRPFCLGLSVLTGTIELTHGSLVAYVYWGTGPSLFQLMTCLVKCYT